MIIDYPNPLRRSRTLSTALVFDDQDSRCSQIGQSLRQSLQIEGKLSGRDKLVEDYDEPREDYDEPRYTLTETGREGLAAIGAIQGWLDKAPGGRLVLADEEGQVPVRAFVDGWSAGILGALAPGPLTAKELGLALDTLSHSSLRKKLATMREAELIEARPDDGEGVLYAVTDWLREAIGPVALTIRGEMRHPDGLLAPLPPGGIDTAFLLALPLLELSRELSGSCQLLVDLPEGDGRCAAGAMIRVEGGRVASCSADLEGTADSWAMGSAMAWLEAAIEGDTAEIEFGGEGRLARAVLAALHMRLFQE